MKKTLLIIPAYNEEESILSLVKEIENYPYDYIFINDCSTDSTPEILRKNSINHVDLPANLGIGGAVQTGYIYAKENNYDIAIQVDGDGQHDIAYAQKLIDKIAEGYDLVIGSRYIEKTDGFQSTIMRRVGIKWLSGVIKVFFRKKITDPTSGFRAAGRKTIELFCKNYPLDYPEPDSTSDCIKRGLKVTEVPVIMRERSGGVSSIRSFSTIFYMIKVTLALLIRSMYKE